MIALKFGVAQNPKQWENTVVINFMMDASRNNLLQDVKL